MTTYRAYHYACRVCGHDDCEIQEAPTESQPCSKCGSQSSLVEPPREYPSLQRRTGGSMLTDPSHLIPPIGWLQGNTAAAQHERYRAVIETNRKRAQAIAASSSKKPDGSPRMIGQMPREMAVALMSQHGKDYLTRDPVGALAREGLLFDTK